jgi:hypothetical protein
MITFLQKFQNQDSFDSLFSIQLFGSIINIIESHNSSVSSLFQYFWNSNQQLHSYFRRIPFLKLRFFGIFQSNMKIFLIEIEIKTNHV